VSKRFKYPRTLHLPWSESITSDDKVLKSIDSFLGKHVIITTKMDGGNISMYYDHIHARSVESKHHVSQTWVKQFHSQIRHNIPEGYRVCGENLYAVHTIFYNDLLSFFYGFSIWDDKNICLCYNETREWFELLGIIHVPVIYDGIFDENKIKQLDVEYEEGYVIRIADSFHYDNFQHCVAKFVRKTFRIPNKHWMHRGILLNELYRTTETNQKNNIW
jgi:hypothetical protein